MEPRLARVLRCRPSASPPTRCCIRFRYCDLLLAEAERAAWQSTLDCADLSALCGGGDLSPAAGAARRVAPSESGDKSPQSKALRAVSERAAQTLQWSTDVFDFGLLNIPLDHLTLGRAAVCAAILKSPTSDFRIPTSHFDAAVSGLRRAGVVEFLVRGLLTRAWLRSLTGVAGAPPGGLPTSSGPAASESAQGHLDEAWEIAVRGPMPFFLAEIHLHRARLYGRTNDESRMTKYPWNSPQDDLAEARKLIVKHGHLRRLPELEDAEAALNAPGNPL